MSIRPRSLTLGAFLVLGACFSPGGQLTDVTSDASTSTTATASTTASTTAGVTTESTATPTTTAPPTTDSTTDPTGGTCGTCTPPTPYCAPTGDCIGCEQFPAHDLSCGSIDAATPLCDQVNGVGSGLCVQCLSTLDCNAQLCHPEDHTCVDCVTDMDCPADPKQFCDGGTCGACDTHDECTSGACEVDIGKCFPVRESRHWYVDIDERACGTGDCTELAPCCEISDAFTALASGGEKYHIVHVAPGTYTKRLVLANTDKQVAVLGEPGVELDVTADDQPLVLLGNVVLMPPPHLDSKLFLSRLGITGSGAVAVSCFDATFLGLDEVTASDVKGGSLFVSKCLAWARRSQFLRNGGGLLLSDGKARLENSILSGSTMTAALVIELLSELDILYSTIAQQTGIPGTLLSCASKNGIEPGSVNIRNSAVLNGLINVPMNCTANVVASYSATTIATLAMLGDGNVMVDPDKVSAPFINWDTSNLYLGGLGDYLKDVARWKTGDPPTDIAGLARPAVNDAPDIAGAALPADP